MEGELRRGLLRHRPPDAGPDIDLEVASRTDRGVSARANALTLRSALGGSSLLRQLNGLDPSIFCTAATEVPPSFRVRDAQSRTYRYFEAGADHDVGVWNRAAQILTGTLDVRSFGRQIPSGAPCWRTIDALEVSRARGGLVVEVRARSFVWGMVRKLIGAFREHEAGRLSLAKLEDAVRGRARLALPLAEPEGLILWEVKFPQRWTVRWSGPTRHQAAAAARRERELRARAWILAGLGVPTRDAGAVGTPSASRRAPSVRASGPR